MNFQDNTKVMKISVAGFSTGLPSQKARLAPTDTLRLRRPAAIGAAQHVHIIPGKETMPPRKVLLNRLLPRTLCNH
ncbi:hypothetical protein D3C76_1570860 [compost metagenome]